MPNQNQSSPIKGQLLTTAVIIVVIAGILILLRLIEPSLREYAANMMSGASQETGIIAGETLVNAVRIAKVALWMSLVVAVVRVVRSVIFGTALIRERQTPSLVQNIFSITLYIVAFFLIFQSQYPSVDLAAVFTTSAILGVILGLALQDTLGNLFAGISLQADQPFAVGDVISVGNAGTGVVENITWRGVKIRTFANRLLLISNSVLGKEAIEVAPRNNMNARLVFFSTLYENSPAKIIHVVREAIADAENVSSRMRPVVRIRNFGESGVEWEVKYWLEDYAKYNDTDALVRQLVWYAFLREDLTFPYPTQTIHIERRPRTEHAVEQLNQVFARLSEIGIFEPLSNDETMQLARATGRRIFAPSETIIRQGEPGETMFIINRGRVAIQVGDNGSAPRRVAMLDAGRFFGEMALLTGEPRSATVVTEDETEVFEIGHQAIKSLFAENPYLVEALSRSLTERRALLSAGAALPTDELEREQAGIFDAVKRFFGIS